MMKKLIVLALLLPQMALAACELDGSWLRLTDLSVEHITISENDNGHLFAQWWVPERGALLGWGSAKVGVIYMSFAVPFGPEFYWGEVYVKPLVDGSLSLRTLPLFEKADSYTMVANVWDGCD